MKLEHIISTKQFLDTKILDEIFAIADEMEKKDEAGKLPSTLGDKILATLFYEPSTRTRFSFEAAMQKLGGSVISTESASHFSSVTKGESLEDTIRIVGGYSDAIVLRHPEEGSAKRASGVSPVPVINAGDGSGEHPTQALLDLYTISKEFDDINGLEIALVGDLLYGRTIHSLLDLLGLYESIKIYLVSPYELRVPEHYKQELTTRGIQFEETEVLDTILEHIDVLYVTRIQKERFKSEKDYDELKDAYVIDTKTLEKLKKTARILHPLPRVNEISPEIDEDPRAAYFRQAKNGLYIRMALLEMVIL